MQTGSAKLFIATVLLCTAGGSVLAQVQQTYQAKVGRTLSADEQQVLLLVNESAALLDQGRTEPASSTARRALELAKTTRMRDIEALALHNLARIELKNGNSDAAMRLLRRSLLLYEIEGNIGGQGTIRLEMADMLNQLGQPEASQTQADAARKLSAAAGDSLGLLNATSLAVRTRRGDPATKASQLESLLEQSQSQGSPLAEATALRQQGRRAMDDGNLQAAQQLFERALARALTALNPEAESYSLLALGELSVARYKLPEAMAFYQRALAAARKSKDSGATGNVLLKLALLHGLMGNAELMREQATQAQAAFKADAQLVGQGLASEALGDAEWIDGRRPQAEVFYRAAIKAGETTKQPGNEASARLRLASLLRPTAFEAAKPEAERAIELYKAAGMKSGVAQGLYELGRIHGAANDIRTGLEMIQQSRDLFAQINHQDKVAMADLMIAGGQRYAGNLPEALVAVRRAIDGYGKVGMLADGAKAELEHAEILAKMGDSQGAQAALQRALALARQDGKPKLVETVLRRIDALKKGG
ncbi:hypothetical protein SAMN05216350_102267 [Polaromonas sp. YR568]|uniref:tetratricopeptide repeat protein n=1 Tax=Polaromonas sp. YR568 TaxID=1855301 RepID=UPI0008E913FA|nr:tetratricopeptide repeat protein [Polaromonas sp. YR568]SFU50959.1 hypothetical protein SAMN05216350_102267 [Polaromonas sp. YR568]